MAVTYTTAVKNARLDAVTTAIGTTGVLEIGTTGMASILASISTEPRPVGLILNDSFKAPGFRTSCVARTTS